MIRSKFRIILSIFFTTFLFFQSLNIFQTKAEFDYQNIAKGYFFKLPDNWMEIPKTTLDKYTEEAFKNINVKKIYLINMY